LFTAAEINALFVLEDYTKCPLEQFDVLLPDGSEATVSDLLYSRLDLVNRPADMSLQFNTDIAMTDGTVVTQTFDFKIKATARGNVVLTKDVQVTVVICGSESVSLIDSANYLKTLDIGPTAAPFIANLPSMF